MSSSSGYYTLAAATQATAGSSAPAAQLSAIAGTAAATEAAANTDSLIAELAELHELQNFAAIIVTAPSPAVAPAPTAAAAPTVNTEMVAGGGGGGSSMTPSEAAHVPKLPSTANRVYGMEVGSEGIFVHGLPSSATEPGFRAFICLRTKPSFIPSCLGIKPADLDALYHSVFLQVTRSPNEMFGCWAEDDAEDEGRGADGQTRLRFNRKMLRIRLGKYLARQGRGGEAIGNGVPAQRPGPARPIPSSPGGLLRGRDGHFSERRGQLVVFLCAPRVAPGRHCCRNSDQA